MDYQATYQTTIPKKARLAATLLESDTETETPLVPLITNCHRARSQSIERTPSPVFYFTHKRQVNGEEKVLVDLKAEAFGSSSA